MLVFVRQREKDKDSVYFYPKKKGREGKEGKREDGGQRDSDWLVSSTGA